MSLKIGQRLNPLGLFNPIWGCMSVSPSSCFQGNPLFAQKEGTGHPAFSIWLVPRHPMLLSRILREKKNKHVGKKNNGNETSRRTPSWSWWAPSPAPAPTMASAARSAGSFCYFPVFVCVMCLQTWGFCLRACSLLCLLLCFFV